MGFLLFILYLSTSLALLGAFTWGYIKITPYDEATDISNGNMAPAISLAGAMLGFTFPLLVASYTHSELYWFIGWALVASVIQLGVFWIMHKLLPRVIETNNTAGATCFAAASICVGLINAASFIP